MIVISGQAALSCVQYQEKTKIRQYGVQGINIRPLVENVTKFFVTIDDITKVKYYLEKAFYEVNSGRPGPVWIDVPLDIQSSTVPEDQQETFTPEDGKRKYAVDDAVQTAYHMLCAAKRPIFIAGQGISLADAEKEFRELADRLQTVSYTHLDVYKRQW